MEAKTLFQEKQQFRQWWLWLGLIALNGFIFYKIFIEKDYGNAKNWVELLPVSILFILALFFWFVKMETEIKEDGIYVSFYPLLTKTKFYPWETIEKVTVIKNHSALKYGGWGVRIGAYNVSGSDGMQLELKSGNKLFIGSQQPDEIQVVLNN
jgi:hypothetical protein